MRLVVLIAVFLLICGGYFIFFSTIDYALAGRIALSLMFVFSGVLHLKYQEGIYLTYPKFLSQISKIKLLFIIGDLQFVFACALVFADTAEIFVLFILVYLFLGFFTQINAGIQKISVKRGNYTGHGIVYLLFKIPEQFAIIIWTYYFILVC